MRRYLAIAAAAVGLLSLAAPLAVAATGDPGPSMLRPADLPSRYGHPIDTYVDSSGKGGRPTACQNPVDGRVAAPRRPASRTYVKELTFANGSTWQNVVFVYPTAAVAGSAYRELVSEARKACSMSAVIDIGTDEDSVMARVGLQTTPLPVDHGIARVGIRYDTSLVDAASSPAMYADSHEYAVYAWNGRIISRVGVVQAAPVGAPAAAAAESAATVAARRALALAK